MNQSVKARHISENDGGTDSSLDSHFLADRSLTQKKTISLLLSSSFGANALLYAAFLGYLMGLWALVIQFAWMTSFFLLTRYSKQIYASTSLHEFLGTKFGITTRRLAALCSIIGILYFAGWEIAVAKSSLGSLAQLSTGSISSAWKGAAFSVLFGAVAVALAYTVLWGRRASGSVNLILNLVKIGCLLSVTAILFGSLLINHTFTQNLFWPPIGEAVRNLGLIALVTNIIFNISWQFVDNSSWQSISSSRNDEKHIQRSIRLAGIGTLITVNGLGTVLGALLRNNTAVDSSNILGYAGAMPTNLHIISFVSSVVLLAFSAMSLFDGAILSVTQSVLVDLQAKWAFATRITMFHARIATLIIGILAALGVNSAIQALGGSIFNFVYVIIIVQLSLTGPVVVGLVKGGGAYKMWLAILFGLIAGGTATFYGTTHNNQDLVTAAGTITTATSVVVAFILSAAYGKTSRKAS